jgi:hypothetical protein
MEPNPKTRQAAYPNESRAQHNAVRLPPSSIWLEAFGSKRLRVLSGRIGGSLLIVLHEGDERDALTGLGHADALAGEDVESALAAEVSAPKRWRETLDGVPEHRPGHLLRVLPQELLLGRTIPLADFAEHPARRLVNEIVRVVS